MEYQQPGMGWIPDFRDYTFEIKESLENKTKEKIEELLSPIGLDKVDFTFLPSSVDLRLWCSKTENQGHRIVHGQCSSNLGMMIV